MKKKEFLADDKEREKKKESEKRFEDVDQEAICEEIFAACQSNDCLRLMYGMFANSFRSVIMCAVARNEIYAAVSRNYFLRMVKPIFYYISSELFSRCN